MFKPKINHLTLLLSLFSFFLLTGMGAKPSDFATVTGTSIADKEILTKNKPFLISFSEDMVDEASLNKEVSSADMPFTISPTVKGIGFWVNSKSFNFQAEKAFPRGHEYRIILNEKLKSLSGKPVEHFFSFSTKALQVTRIYAQSYDPFTKTMSVDLGFNMPVPKKGLEKHLQIKDLESGELLSPTIDGDKKDASYYNILINFEKYRAKIDFRITADSGSDGLGLKSDYNSILTIPDPAKGLSVDIKHASENKEASSQDIYSSDAYDDEESGEYFVRFYLKESIDQADYQSFIEIEPKLAFTLDSNNSVIMVNEKLEPGMTITVSLLPGLQDSQGRVLDKKISSSVKCKDRSPRLVFMDPGTYLSPSHSADLGLEFTNIEEIYLSLTELYDNNLPVFYNFDQNSNFGKLIGSKVVDISEPKNEILQRSVNVAELAGKKNGIYVLSINTRPWTSSKNKVLVLTDMGIVSRSFDSGLSTFVSSISTGKAVAAADISVYSASNQLILKGKTDKNGVFNYKQKDKWDKDLSPSLIIAEKNADKSVLPLAYNYRQNTESPGTRPWLSQNYDSFLYSPRTLFKPGDEVDIKAFVREAGGKIPKSFPLQLLIENPRLSEVAKLSAELSDFGAADFKFKLADSALTGFYRAKLIIPGQKDQILGNSFFQVEDFVPPRLELDILPLKEFLEKDDKVEVNLDAQYLFGAPGKGLNYELGYELSAQSFKNENYKKYTFGDENEKFNKEIKLKQFGGSTDKDGKAHISFDIPDNWTAPALLGVKLIASVQEDSGRWVSSTKDISYMPTDFILGMEIIKKADNPADEEMALFRDGPVRVKAVALKANAEPAEIDEITAELLYVDSWWTTIRRDNRYLYQENKKLQSIDSQIYKVSNGEIEFNLEPDRNGRFMLRLMANDSQGELIKASSVFYYSSQDAEASDTGSGRMDLVELSLDKKEYLPGETAQLEIKAPFSGTLLLGMEQENILSTQVIELKEKNTLITLPVKKEYSPNVNITAWLLRPVEAEEKNWFSHRAFGLTSLNISSADKALHVNYEDPGLVMPSSRLEIPITITDSEGKGVKGEFSAALVDEGILSLNSFETPDPLKHFYAQRFPAGSTYDLFDALINPALQIKNLLKAGGDAGAEHYQGSLKAQNVYLAAFEEKLLSDTDGQVTLSFDLPEYSGKARLMLVGSSGNAYASSAKEIHIGRDIEVEIAAPEFAAPGDEFPLLFKAFSRDKSKKPNVIVSIEKEGPIKIPGEYSSPFALADGVRKIMLKADSDEGLVRLNIKVSVPGREDLSFNKKLEFIIRSPYPSSSAVATAVIEGEESAKLKIEGEWNLGRARAKLALDSSPLISILPALEYINSSRYSNLEIHLAQAWSYLCLPDIQKSLKGQLIKEEEKQEKAEDTSENKDENNQAQEISLKNQGSTSWSEASINSLLQNSINQLGTMQTADGGFASHAGLYTSDPWLSIFTSFFLLEVNAVQTVPSDLLKNALNYLNFILASPVSYFETDEELAYSSKAFAAFVLTKSGKEALSWIQHLSGFEGKMNPSGKIFLAGAKALAEGKSDSLKTIELSPIFTDETKNKNTDPGAQAKELALRLYLWSLLDPQAKETEVLFFKNIKAFEENKDYSATNTALISLALSTYSKAKGLSSSKELQAEVFFRGEKIAEAQKTSESLNLDLSRDIENKKLPLVELRNLSKDKLFASLSLRAVPLGEVKPFASGLALERRWYREDGEEIKDLKRIEMEKGERIIAEIRLKVESPQKNLVISDLVAGGMSIENSKILLGRDGKELKFEKYKYLISDLRNDRLLIYAGQVDDELLYRYSLRALFEGSFKIAPLAAEALNNPGVSALGEGGVLIIKQAE